MKITSAVFIKSCTEQRHFPKENITEIAFVGRSNVGKSSLINSLILRRDLVKTSSTPGKTQVINFFKINNAFNFVDLPGYGYAKAPKEIREKWGPMIEGYLSNRKELKAVVFILDIRHLPTEDDKRMREWLDYYKTPVIYAATKADKIKPREIEYQIEKIKETLGLQEETTILTFSAKTRMGREALWKIINRLIKDLQ
jgi:GTP-binding protein